MELFELIDESKAENNGLALIKKTSFKKQAKQINRNEAFTTLIDQVGWPNANEVVYLKSNGCSDTGSIFIDACNRFGKIKELYLSTWIISRSSIEYLCNLIDNGNLDLLYFAVSKRLKELKKSDYAYLVEQFTMRDKIKFKVLNCHAKTFSFNTEKDYYTVTGSGNWTQNPRIENYIIINDKEAFDFNKDWITELM